ncbi:hypothetical protein ACS0TY_027269 [Phlomoides rotata]
MPHAILDVFEMESSLPPSRLFNGYVVDADNLVPKVLPIFKSIENEGGEGVGSIKKLTFTVGDKEHYVKHRTDVLDKENREFKYTVIEGGDLSDQFECITNTVKVVPGPNGGSIYKSNTTYHPKTNPDYNKVQETILRTNEGSKAFFRAVEAHLHANPNDYN